MQHGSLIFSGFIKSGNLVKAILCAESMQQQGIVLTRDQAYHWLRECSKHREIGLDYIKRLQSLLVVNKLDSIHVLAHHLIRQFTLCGSLVDANRTFNKLVNPTAYAWSAIISSHAKLGKPESALLLYGRMLESGITTDRYVFLAILTACKTLETTRLIHSHIVQCGLQSVIMLGNVLIDVYAKCGSLKDSRILFDKLWNRDVVSCNSMIAAYTLHGELYHAIDCFVTMQVQGIESDYVTLSSVLAVCSILGAIELGRFVHHKIVESGREQKVKVGTALLEMYGRCGSLDESLDVFCQVRNHDVVSWGALIAACVQCGESDFAMKCFQLMKDDGFMPNEVSFTSVLAACSNAGMVEEGCKYFELMINVYRLTPGPSHLLCVINLLSRSGRLAQAENLLQSMGLNAIVGWRSLLTACGIYGNVERGRNCYSHCVQLEPNNASGYVLMSKIYSDANILEETNDSQ